MNNIVKQRLLEIFWASVAILAGALLTHLGLQLLSVRLDVFFGISTFSPTWILAVFFVPFLAGILVSAIYGLGGKILAYFAPLLVLVPNYFALDAHMLPDGMSKLPLGYWMLVVIVAIEFSALGGIVGEVIIKKTYGRRPKHLFHKRYQQSMRERLNLSKELAENETSS
ncbi:MAG: hypothetical protein OEZ58_05810 [Gammaproteobacteria bacterium]|nr:hypothetical protein [Gammaproteobacteria bacterium]MDH5728483.1 hypothetical protein [Gammaproteobacteria bacterium]